VELRYLTSFLAIADELHFGRAAVRVHLTQPALSQQLQRLERAVGVELVRRTSRVVALTPAGEVFAEHARTIGRQWDRAVEATRAAAKGQAGTITVGYNFPAAQRILPATLGRLEREHPEVNVALWERRTGPQLGALAAGELDVALVYGKPDDAGFATRFLERVPVVAVVGRQHPWAGRAGVDFRELAEQECILFSRAQSPALHDAISSAARRAGIRLTVVDNVDDPGATALMVSVRSVVGFASTARGNTAGPAVPVSLRAPEPSVDLYAVWRTDHVPAVDTFLASLES
jgi:DNA-binding transcriptional LysR family regulator